MPAVISAVTTATTGQASASAAVAAHPIDENASAKVASRGRGLAAAELAAPRLHPKPQLRSDAYDQATGADFTSATIGCIVEM
jgi:hypothetical protein